MPTEFENKNSHLLATLDIGTTKVIFAIGSTNDSGQLKVLGLGSSVNTGIRNGSIIHLEAIVDAIQEARLEAEKSAGLKSPSSVWLSCGGPHIKSFDSSGMIAVYNKEINETHVQRVLEMAQATWVPMDRHILHVLTQGFKVDHQEGISDPKGMSGVRLEASVHIITAQLQVFQSYLKCVQKAGLKTKDVVLRQYASSLSTLSEDEKRMGVSLIDMGGESCDMITFHQGSVVQTATLPMGGDHFTQDIMLALGISQSAAEKIKRRYAYALSDMVPEDEMVKLEPMMEERSHHHSGGKKTFERKKLCQVIEARAKDMFYLLREKIEKSGYAQSLSSGLVFTGGSSHVQGLVEAGSFFSRFPTRKAYPMRLKGEEENRSLKNEELDPSLATAFGLLIYGAYQESKRQRKSSLSMKTKWNTSTYKKWNQFLKNIWEKTFPSPTIGRSEHV